MKKTKTKLKRAMVKGNKYKEKTMAKMEKAKRKKRKATKIMIIMKKKDK